MCISGLDQVEYREELSDAGELVRHFSAAGGPEYMREIDFPDGGSVLLIRCMTDRWSAEGGLDPTTLRSISPPEGRGCVP
jgi:hypothetical protein